MKKIILFLCIGFFTIACHSTRHSNPSEQKSLDLSKYKTYSLKATRPADSEDPVFKWSQFEERVRRELNFLLPSIGLDPAARRPDLYVFFFTITDQAQIPIRTYESKQWEWDELPENLLVVDFVEPNTENLIWRGWINLPFNDQDKTFEMLPKKLQQLVSEIPIRTPEKKQR